MTVNFNKILLFIVPLALFWSCQEPKSSESEKATSDSTSQQSEKLPHQEKKVVLFFGNSLTAAYGLDPSEGFAGRIQQRVDSLGWPVEVVNAGVTGETTASGRNRLEWVLKRQKVDVFILELGANDGLRGIPTAETERNLKAMIDLARDYHADVRIILAGMMVPPNMGADYSEDFSEVFPRVAEVKDVKLIPFLLEGVAGESDLNLEDGIHPNVKGHRVVTETVWEILQPVLKEELKGS